MAHSTKRIQTQKKIKKNKTGLKKKPPTTHFPPLWSSPRSWLLLPYIPQGAANATGLVSIWFLFFFFLGAIYYLAIQSPCAVCVCLVYACGVCVYCAAGPSSSHIVGEYSRAGGQPTLKVFSLPSCRPAATPDGCLFCFILLFFLFILISISDSPTQTN